MEGWNEKLLAFVEAGNLMGVAAALGNGADVNCATGDGWTPLLTASKDNLDIVRRLLSAGADPNRASVHGYTPLMRAAGHDAVEIVQLLITAGADLHARDEKGLSARDMALHQRCYEAAEVVGSAVRKHLADLGRPVIHLGSCEALFFMQSILLGLRIAPGYHRVRATLADGTQLDEARVYDTIVLEVPPEHAGKALSRLEVLYPDSPHSAADARNKQVTQI
jgi:hypothetical protein